MDEDNDQSLPDEMQAAEKDQSEGNQATGGTSERKFTKSKRSK